MSSEIVAYFQALNDCILQVACTDRTGKHLRQDDAFNRVARLACDASLGDNKIMFIGNGGSASIASHMAIDFSKNGGLRSLAFNDSAALTCLSNDLGYERVFEKQIELHARRGDVLVAISSSGRSPNILRAAAMAADMGCDVVTYSGFTPDNPLRGRGNVNFYVASSEYGFVEVVHLALIHSVLDLTMRGVLAPGRWKLPKSAAAKTDPRREFARPRGEMQNGATAPVRGVDEEWIDS